MWATIVAFLICILPTILVFVVRATESALGCPIQLGETLPCMLGSTNIRGFLDGLEVPFYLLHQQNYFVVMACLLGWAAIIIYWIAKRTRGNADVETGGAWSNRRLLWAAIITLVIGVGPVASNILSDEIASLLGCYVNEHGAYTDRPGEFGYPVSISGCALGNAEIGWILHFLHMLILAVLLTWPFFLISLFLWAKVIQRRITRLSA